MKIETPIQYEASIALAQHIIDKLKDTLNVFIVSVKNHRVDDYINIIDRFREEAVRVTEPTIRDFFRGLFEYGRSSVLEDDVSHPVDRETELAGILSTHVISDDTYVLSAFQQMRPMLGDFKDMTREISDDLRQVVANSFKEGYSPSLQNLVMDMEDVIDANTFRLERIARSESHRFILEGRAKEFDDVSHDLEMDMYFVWDIVDDSRTSETCREIKRRVESKASQLGLPGLSLQDLKDIVLDVQTEMMGDSWAPSDWLVHPYCRSLFRRVD